MKLTMKEYFSNPLVILQKKNGNSKEIIPKFEISH